MCNLDPERVAVGIDGCSAPVFATPLWNAALGFARLCDPFDQSSRRANACKTITDAMTSYPEMISGPGKFDTRLMKTTKGKIVSKGGAEGYQQIGIMPGTIELGSPGIGIALKISDGDRRGIVRPAVILDILRKLKAITSSELDELAEFGPRLPVKNWREIVVGESYPTFD
jgi:L-asparaginase II